MLKIDVIKFEAQDVITSSIPTPNNKECICEPYMTGSMTEPICRYHEECEAIPHGPNCIKK